MHHKAKIDNKKGKEHLQHYNNDYNNHSFISNFRPIGHTRLQSTERNF